MHRPRPLLSLARPLIFLSFWFVLPQIQHDRLVIHSTVKLLLVHPLENKPSVSFPPPSSGSFSVLSFFPVFLTQHSSLSVGLSSPCLSVLLQSHLASRRLHSASYPFLKSAFQRGPAFLASLSSFFLSMRIFQLQNTRVRIHTLLSNPIKSCWMGSSDLAVKKVPQKIHTAFPSFTVWLYVQQAPLFSTALPLVTALLSPWSWSCSAASASEQTAYIFHSPASFTQLTVNPPSPTVGKPIPAHNLLPHSH